MSNQEPLTNEQKVSQVKGILMQNLNQFYGQLVNFVRQTPIDDNLKEYAVMNLDQGVMWFEQGLKKLQFKVEDNQPKEVNNESEEASNESESQSESPCEEGSSCSEESQAIEGEVIPPTA